MSLSTIVFLLFIALILFGPEDLPVIARALGKLIYEIRKATEELTSEFTQVVNTPTNTLNKTIDELINPSSSNKQEKYSSEWKEIDDNKKQEISLSDNNKDEDLLTYDEINSDETNCEEEEENIDNPLSQLSEEFVSYNKKDVSR